MEEKSRETEVFYNRILQFDDIFLYLSLIGVELITGLFDHFFADFTDIIIVLGVGIGTPNTINAMPCGLTF